MQAGVGDGISGWGNKMIYTLTIPGRPLPKGRPRFTRSGHAYTPRTTRLYEAKIRAICTAHFDEPITEPVSVELKFYITGKRLIDVDNLIKAALDGLQPTDDSLVYKVTGERIPVYNAKEQCTEVSIWHRVLEP
jgi:crossover junction endodeoxyribonuclease RusA